MKFEICQPFTKLFDIYSTKHVYSMNQKHLYFINDKQVTAEEYFGFAERYFDLQYKWATNRWDTEEYEYHLSLLKEDLNG